jgi:hypothetical protein
MVKQLPAVDAFGTYTPIQVHPAPDADYWGEGESNVHSMLVTSAEATVWEANDRATLVLVDMSEAVTMNGFPLRAGQQYSFGIPAGANIAFQAVGDDATVTVLES